MLSPLFSSTKTLGKLLKKFRVDHEMTAAELAKELSISPAFLSRFETENKKGKVSKKLRERLCKLFLSKGYSELDIFKLNCMIDVTNGYINIKDMPKEKKLLLSKLSSMQLTEEQIHQLKQISGLTFL